MTSEKVSCGFIRLTYFTSIDSSPMATDETPEIPFTPEQQAWLRNTFGPAAGGNQVEETPAQTGAATPTHSLDQPGSSGAGEWPRLIL